MHRRTIDAARTQWFPTACALRSLAMLASFIGPTLAQDTAIAPSPASLRFDVSMPFGDFVHHKGGSGKRFLVETMGSGVALIDYDSDGDLDVYLLQGAALPGDTELAVAPRNRLFENRLNGTGERSFVDVTEASGLGDPGYAMGVSVGDIDGDGDTDVFIGNFGSNRLYRNDQGHFTDITSKADVGDSAWAASSAFADFDGDGRLDLYVSNYLSFTPETHKNCTLGHGIPAYCSPDAYDGVLDRIYRNLGDGRFEDMSSRVGLERFPGKTLGVVAADFDRDGDIDLYLANDGEANQLLVNDGAWHFTDNTLFSGAGYSGDGMAQAGMGVAYGDSDGDGRLDLFVTNLSAETNVLYRGDGTAFFSEVTAAARLSAPSLLYTGFGTTFGDYDGDGDLDLYVANGHVIDNIAEFNDHQSYLQPDQIYRNDGGRYVVLTPAEWGNRQPDAAGRGLAQGDLDLDGDLDLVVTNCGGRPRLLTNRSRRIAEQSWLAIRLVGTQSSRDAVGARVELEARGHKWVQERFGGGSYLSQSSALLHFGLGTATVVDQVDIFWPSGRRSHDEQVTVARVVEYREPK